MVWSKVRVRIGGDILSGIGSEELLEGDWSLDLEAGIWVRVDEICQGAWVGWKLRRDVNKLHEELLDLGTSEMWGSAKGANTSER